MTNLRKRFLEKFTIGDACWEWTGSNDRGYPIFYLSHTNKIRGTHLAIDVPAGLDALHKCDNPRCVRPSHLFSGTQADNVADMVSKGRRFADGLKYVDHEKRIAALPRGHAHSKAGAKINQDIADEIRQAEGSQSSIAKRFCIHQSQVSRIKQSIAWNKYDAEVREMSQE